MPDRKHHTEKFRRCVEQVMAKGESEDSAYAICTTSLQKAGEAIYEQAEMYGLHLRAATGEVRAEMVNGKEHLVVPVVALIEGVIHAVNADTPEFVPWKCIERIATSFNGKPVTLGHPAKDGKQCSAALPGIVQSHGIGTIRNARAESTGKKLLMEALIDKTRAKELHPEMFQTLTDGGVVEVSVGAWVVTDELEGAHKEKPFKAQWLTGSGDHLAFLPGGRGACSVAMGCGTHRAAMHLVTAEAIVPLTEYIPVLAFSTLEAKSLEDRMRAVNMAVHERWAPKSEGEPTVAAAAPWPYVMQTFDDRAIVQVGDEIYSVKYDVSKAGDIALGEAVRVKQAWVAAARKGKYHDCPTCKGSGEKDGNPCETCEGKGEIKHRSMSALLGVCACTPAIKTLHDHAMKSLGAQPGHPFYGNQHEERRTVAEKDVQEAREKVNVFYSSDRIRNEGGYWVLYGTDGMRLGQYRTQVEAETHGMAIEQVLSRR